MNVGKLFRDILTFNGEKAIFNELTFTVNKEHTHFEASSIMTQCASYLGALDKKGLPSKTWSLFVRGKNGQLITYYETKGSHKKFRWVDFKDLLPILTYSMSDGNTVNKFLNNEAWADPSGYVYLVKCVINNETIYKYGHSWDVNQRMNGYKRECDSFELFASCKVDDMLDVEAAIGEYIYSHGGEHHSRGDEWFKYLSIDLTQSNTTSNDVRIDHERAIADWAYAVFLCDDSYNTKMICYVDY